MGECTKMSRPAGGIDMLSCGIAHGFFVAKKQHGKRAIFYQKSLTHFRGDLDFYCPARNCVRQPTDPNNYRKGLP